MPRRARVVVPGTPHHITQRGNNRQTIFQSDSDRELYLEMLSRHSSANRLRVLGYCLMSNHVHLVAVPERRDSLARTLQCAHSEYAAEWNRSERRSGHVWQGRYFSCRLDPAHLVTALRYVDMNPVRARLVDTAAQWDWSSARAHTDARRHDAVLGFDWAEWFEAWDYSGWKRTLEPETGLDGDWETLRHSTMTGAPLGSAEFVRQMEKKEGRRLRVRERGRPRKSKGAGGIAGVQLGLF